MEEILRKIPGVLETSVGYEGGTSPNPTYEDVRTGKTGYAEAVRIVFDPSEDLLRRSLGEVVLSHARPDHQKPPGQRRRYAIQVGDLRHLARATGGRRCARKRSSPRAASGARPSSTEIVDAGPFTAAEDDHQKYLEKHPGGYSCHFLRD
jgi:peptide methionine sulfoxide reductase msrA/msrB